MSDRMFPNQSYDYLLGPVSGFNMMHDLEISASVDSESDEIFRGSICSLNASGEIKLGCADTAMPLFAQNGSEDPDVAMDESIGLASGISAFPATGGYEIYTTEFVDDTYVPNDFLTASSGSVGEVEKSATAYNDALVCGCVSRGTATKHTSSVLYFWTMFIPAINIT